MKYALADQETAEDVTVGWLSYVTQDFPDGLFRGSDHAMTFDTQAQAEAYKVEHGLEGLFIRPLIPTYREKIDALRNPDTARWEARFSVPPVQTFNWDDDAWIAHIDHCKGWRLREAPTT